MYTFNKFVKLILCRYLPLFYCLCVPVFAEPQGVEQIYPGQAKLGEAIVVEEWEWLPTQTGQINTASDANTSGFAINILDREQVRIFFNTVFQASENVASDWTGQISTCYAGDTSQQYKQATLARINYFRAMAGVPAAVTLNAGYNDKAQQAALMMSAENNLSHTPPASWACYSSEGAEAASNSNLSLGNAGADAVWGQMQDEGSNNAPVGHRRWLLYPQTQEMGVGDVTPSANYARANDVWVFDDHIWDARPATRDEFVSWPPPGYVPNELAFPRWSFSYPGVNFSSVGVTMRRVSDGSNIPLTVEHRTSSSGLGENTIVWRPDTTSFTSLLAQDESGDITLEVTVSNVLIQGSLRNFTYTVILFDPTTTSANTVLPVLTGPLEAAVNQVTNYNFTAVPNAGGYQFLMAKTAAFATQTAETGLEQMQADIASDYSAITNDVAAEGVAAFHLAHPYPPNIQLLSIQPLLVIADNATLNFDSRLGWATSTQIAKVQISTDNGSSWANLYTQSGNDGNGESGFTTRHIDLHEYAGKLVNIRFAYDFAGGSYYSQTASGVGWYIDNIALSHVSTLDNPLVASTDSEHDFSITPLTTGPYILSVRATMFGGYPLDWSPVLAITAMTEVVSDVLDIDQSGLADALSDGLIIIRFLFGFTGDTLINGAVSNTCTLCSAEAIAAQLAQVEAVFDVDDNGQLDALGDGLIIIRYLFGFQGDALITGAVANNCKRCSSGEIYAYLEAL